MSSHLIGNPDNVHHIRDQTAELASYALSEAANSYQSRRSSSIAESSYSHGPHGEMPALSLPAPIIRPTVASNNLDIDSINEVTEPPSPESSHAQSGALRVSHLTNMLRASPPEISSSHSNRVVGGGGYSPESPNERATLLSKTQRSKSPHRGYNAINSIHLDGDDVESQSEDRFLVAPRSGIRNALWENMHALTNIGAIFPEKLRWPSSTGVWHQIIAPVGYLPAVSLGLLLNVLDGLSYGM